MHEFLRPPILLLKHSHGFLCTPPDRGNAFRTKEFRPWCGCFSVVPRTAPKLPWSAPKFSSVPRLLPCESVGFVALGKPHGLDTHRLWYTLPFCAALGENRPVCDGKTLGSTPSGGVWNHVAKQPARSGSGGIAGVCAAANSAFALEPAKEWAPRNLSLVHQWPEFP